MLSIIILYHKKLELRKRFKFRSAALWKREEYEVTLFGSERITKRRTLEARGIRSDALWKREDYEAAHFERAH